MKNKIWMCVIIFAFVIINVSCNSKIESDTIGSEKDFNDNTEDASEDDPEYTDEYFVENYSIYRNPIDKYFWSKLYSWNASQQEIRQARNAYNEAWKTEYKNMMRWLKEKCIYEEDKKNISLLEKSISDQIEIEKKVMKTELTNAYEINPDPSKVENDFSRISLLGHGMQERLNQSEGELYRDVCMRILNLHGQADGEYEFKFRETDYMK